MGHRESVLSHIQYSEEKEMIRRYLQNNLLSRLLLIAAVLAGAAFTGYRSVYAATVNVACDVAQLSSSINTTNGNNQDDTITLQAGCVYTLNAVLPVIGSDNGHRLAIVGNGAVLDGANTFEVIDNYIG